MRPEGLNIYVCVFPQVHFRKKKCWQILYNASVSFPVGPNTPGQTDCEEEDLNIFKKSSECITLLKHKNVSQQAHSFYSY